MENNKNVIIDVDDSKSVLIQEDGDTYRERRLFNINEMMGANYWLMEGSNIKFKLSANQMKIIKIAMAMVNPKEKIDFTKPLMSYTFTVDKLLEILGLDNNFQRYDGIPDFLKELHASDSFSYSTNKGHLVLIHMFDKVIYKPEKLEVTFRFSWSMIEDFLSIENKVDGTWQSYKIGNIMKFENVYSINIYGICKVKLKGVKERLFEIDITDFKIQLDIYNPEKPEEEKYKRYFDFKKNVIDKSFNEINNTKDIDMKLSYTERKKGKSVVSLIIKVVNLKYSAKAKPELPPKTDENTAFDESACGSEYIDAEFEEVKEDSMNETETNIVRALRVFIAEPLPIKSLLTIFKIANGNIEMIKEKYELSKQNKTQIPNLGGWLNSAIKNDWRKPVSSKKTGGFNDYDQRAYDYAELEKKLLGWNNTEIVEEEAIEQTSIIIGGREFGKSIENQEE